MTFGTSSVTRQPPSGLPPASRCSPTSTLTAGSGNSSGVDALAALVVNPPAPGSKVTGVGQVPDPDHRSQLPSSSVADPVVVGVERLEQRPHAVGRPAVLHGSR